MTLFIDSTKNTEFIIRLDEQEKRITNNNPRDQDILLSIHQFLGEQGKELKDLTAIKIVEGPGTFTSLRLGVTIANTLSFALGIPVNNLPQGDWVEPEYGKPPSINKR